ncbi:hypothetical protein [Rhodococcus sp. IEGM 1379]|uniref:hypothetical protein n=1 Tax=Rhodococcus sp. IEGM 1379 TaxID=3047086 RepID=UPI0024B7C1E8|nr:hypothetical protein [Rhodococcus sp. IEGM 1379]MDI9918712.1 hypothetical protein [Rhodococcus sp. IEGM 1379]
MKWPALQFVYVHREEEFARLDNGTKPLGTITSSGFEPLMQRLRFLVVRSAGREDCAATLAPNKLGQMPSTLRRFSARPGPAGTTFAVPCGKNVTQASLIDSNLGGFVLIAMTRLPDTFGDLSAVKAIGRDLNWLLVCKRITSTRGAIGIALLRHSIRRSERAQQCEVLSCLFPLLVGEHKLGMIGEVHSWRARGPFTASVSN